MKKAHARKLSFASKLTSPKPIYAVYGIVLLFALVGVYMIDIASTPGSPTGYVLYEKTVQPASISVTTMPPGSALYLDSVYMGETPLTVSGVSIGTHDIKITQKSYRPYVAVKYIASGDNVLYISLKAE